MSQPLDPHQLDTILQQSLRPWLGNLLGNLSPDLSPDLLPNQSPQLPQFDIHTYKIADSTNLRVWDWFDRGAQEGTVAIAHTQQAGRGQRGRSWQSSPGGLYLSLGLQPNQDALNAAGLTIGCAWGIAAIFRQWAIPVGLKWLNDLILDGKKLGGILTETRIQQGRIQQAVVGIGLNWQNEVPAPGIALYPYLTESWPVQGVPRHSTENLAAARTLDPTSQNAEATSASLVPPSSHELPIASLEHLAALVLTGAWAGYWLWKTQGMAALLPRYEALLLNRGQVVTLDGETGTVQGITPLGHLRVQFSLPDGGTHERHLQSGEIQLGYGDRPPLASSE